MIRIVCVLSACVLLSVIALGAGSFLNDTGEDVIGLRVVFSEPVQITSFGDALMRVDHTENPNEVVFSGGLMSPWYLQWFLYTPQSATIVEHEWILPGSDLPLLAIKSGEAARTVAIDGFSDSESGIKVWWGGMTHLGNQRWSIVDLQPMYEEGAQFIRGCSPRQRDDGHHLMILVADEVLDATHYDGVMVTLRASAPCRVELGITWYDPNLEDVCDEDYPDYAQPSDILVFEDFATHLIPFSRYRVEEYTANVCPGVSSTLGTHALKEFKFYILCSVVCVDIREVSLYKTGQ